MIDKIKEFEIQFKKNYKRQFLISYRITQNQFASEDIIHDVYLKFWEDELTLNNSDSLERYLTKAIYNRSLNYLRDTKKTVSLHAFAEEESIGKHETRESLSAMDFNLLKQTVRDAINELPPQCKTIFLLARKEQLKYKEIAELLDLSVKTVEKQMSLAIKKINYNLKPEIKHIFLSVFIALLFLIDNI